MTSTRIGQVRIRTNTDDPLAARMRGDAALRALDLEPAAMPARTILCIRTLDDPLPGGIDLRSSHAPRATAWERAARNAVANAFHRAVRVIDGDVPANTNAVLFDDRAELLACAARDVVRGGGGWWWRDIVRGGLTFEHVVREWVRSPEYVPAALELLLPQNIAIAFVRMLDEQQALELLTNVLRVHAMESFARELVEALATNAQNNSPREMHQAIASPIARKLAPEFATINMLTIEQHLFATITLVLRRAPAIARSATFAQEVTAWIAPTPAGSSRALAAHEPSQDQRSPSATPSVVDEASLRETPVDPSTIEQHVEHATPAQPANEPIPSTPTRPAQSTPTPSPATRAQDITTIPTTSTPIEQLEQQSPQQQTTNNQQPTPSKTIDSQHAGLLFLLNLAIALGLYDPYGREQPLDLNVWDFLALTGRALVPELIEDDLWPLLATLAHRQLDEELPPLDDDLLARIREALSLVIDDEDAARFVIQRPGRITLSPVHLDVTFCLAAHPIEIRLAGLDRDPGWIPAAGRHVDFHFD